jgi:phosphate transport system substrate-binding protein
MSRTDAQYMSAMVILGVLTAMIAIWPIWWPGGTPATARVADSDAPADIDAEDSISNEELFGELSFVGSTTVQPLVEELGEKYQQHYPNISLNISAGGSVVGIQAVQNGQVDIGMASRALREGEQMDGMEVHKIAIDVLAMIVYPTNPVDNLTLEELQGIYLGEITNWEEVGGEDEEILPVIREVTSGTRGAFDDIVLNGEEPTEDADVQVTASEVEARVATTENAIGYIGFGHIDTSEIKLLTIDGVEPSPEAALDDSYPLQRPLQLLTGPLSRDLSQTFIDFALSEEGQEMVVEEGWVPARHDP